MNDVINAAFELGGTFFIWLHVRQLWRDKRVAGVSLWGTGYFSAWGVWNLYYYPSVDQWWSFWGSVGVTTMNTLWLAMLFYYGVWRVQRT